MPSGAVLAKLSSGPVPGVSSRMLSGTQVSPSMRLTAMALPSAGRWKPYSTPSLVRTMPSTTSSTGPAGVKPPPRHRHARGAPVAIQQSSLAWHSTVSEPARSSIAARRYQASGGPPSSGWRATPSSSVPSSS